MNFSYFTVFLKNRNISSKFKRSKFTDYAALREIVQCGVNRGSYMSTHVLLNLSNELKKRDQRRGLPSIVSLFRHEFNKFNNTAAQMLDSIYHMTLKIF